MSVWGRGLYMRGGEGYTLVSVWGGGVYVGECVGQGPVYEREGGGVYVGECVGGRGIR